MKGKLSYQVYKDSDSYAVSRRDLHIFIIGLILMVFFLYSGITGVLDYTTAEQKMLLQVFPPQFIGYLTWINIILQVVAGAWLLLGLLYQRHMIWAAWYALIVVTIYTLYTIMVVANLFPITPCACISFIEGMTWHESLALNMVLLLLTVVVVKQTRSVLGQ